MDDGFLIILGLAAFAALLLGPIGFFLTIGARTRLIDVEKRLLRAEARLKEVEAQGVAAAPAKPSETSLPGAAPVLQRETLSPEPVIEAAEEHAQPAEAAPTDAPIAANDSAPVQGEAARSKAGSGPKPESSRSLEEALGTRWSVWVGGVALAFGALLLVRYSIEEGLFGPGARVLMGIALAVGLVGAGEFMRRRERKAPSSALSIPAILTAAGTVAAFGAIYAAHGLYGFIGPAPAFLLLGAAGVACMLAAALHGPALAGLGLVGSLLTPLIVQSSEPNPWPVVLYVAVVAAAAYGLARVRNWLWLARAAAAGGFFWGLAFMSQIALFENAFFPAAVVHVLVQGGFACYVFAWSIYRRTADVATLHDRLAVGAPGAFGVLMGLCLLGGAVSSQFGFMWMFGATAMMVLLGATAVFVTPAAALSGVALLLGILAMRAWPGADSDIGPFWLEAGMRAWREPASPTLFALFGIVWGVGLGACNGWRLFFGPRLPMQTAAIYAGAAALTPLLMLIVAWMRFAQGTSNFLFASLAAALAVAFTVAAHLFRERLAGERMPALDLGLGASASAAIAALALGCVMALDGGRLTVALAIAALGAAWVSIRLDIAALRWCVAGLGVAVAARLAWEPRIVGASLGDTPVFNWLLVGYGVPALAFGYAARLMRSANGIEDIPVKVGQALAILFSAFLVFFEIRHFINAGDPYGPTSRLIEQGLFAVSAFGFAIVMTRLDGSRTNPVFHFASLAFGIVSFVLTILGLGVFANPLFTGDHIEGGAVFNSLMIAYLLPGVLALALSRVAVNVRPKWYLQGARVATIALIFAWLTLETRFLFRGPNLRLFGFFLDVRPMSEAEIWAYSAVWLGFGLLLLAYGLWRGSKEARLASAIFVVLSVLKVFLFDLAGLEGIVRALSFIGLGLVLIGIGLVYQKFVFGRRGPSVL